MSTDKSRKYCQSCYCGLKRRPCAGSSTWPRGCVRTPGGVSVPNAGINSRIAIPQFISRSNPKVKNQDSNTASCKRCGECCLKGGPALHVEDMPLIREGIIDLRQIVTIRAGEHAWDQPAGKVLPLETEILKIKGRDGTWACVFYSHEARACGIYNTRPVECEALNCSDPAPLLAIYDRNRLTRADLVPEGHPLRELIDEHDERCSAALLSELANRAIEGDTKAGNELHAMAVYDAELRRLIPERSAFDKEGLDFLLGRPVKALLSGLGIKTYETAGGIRLNIPSKGDRA